MTEQQHAEIVTALAELRRRYPQWRLGQDVEDEQHLAAAREHLEQQSRQAASA